MYAPTDLVPGSWEEVQWIPPDVFFGLGVTITVWRMRALARAGARAPLLRDAADSIVRHADDSVSAARAIRGFLERSVVFTPDPRGVELVKSPVYQLRELELEGRVLGDCDDVAVLGAALGRAVGLPSRFVLLAFTHGAPYEHVFTELHTADGWLELDTTKPDQMPSGLTIVRTSKREA